MSGPIAFGAVYRGYDPTLDREVALKVPHPGSLQTERDRDRFLREPKGQFKNLMAMADRLIGMARAIEKCSQPRTTIIESRRIDSQSSHLAYCVVLRNINMAHCCSSMQASAMRDCSRSGLVRILSLRPARSGVTIWLTCVMRRGTGPQSPERVTAGQHYWRILRRSESALTVAVP